MSPDASGEVAQAPHAEDRPRDPRLAAPIPGADDAWAALRRLEDAAEGDWGAAAPADLPRLVSEVVDALRGAGELQAGAALAVRAAALLGGSAHFTAGSALCDAGQLPESEAALRRYLRESIDRPAAPGDDPRASPLGARHLLGRVAMLDGQLRLAERWLKEALSQAGAAESLPIACDLARVWLRGRRLDRAVAALSDLCDAPGEPRELHLLGAEVALMIGDVERALPLCRAALDRSGADDRAAALLATLHLRRLPRDTELALELLPLLPGRRFDTLAVRLLLLRLRGEVAPEGGEATRSASAVLLSSLPPGAQRRVPALSQAPAPGGSPGGPSEALSEARPEARIEARPGTISSEARG